MIETSNNLPGKSEPDPVTVGPISVFARHPTAANLIMLLMIVACISGIIKMNYHFLPSFGIDVGTVTIDWPGANPEDIDSNIVQLVEPEVRFLDSVKRVRSTSYEGAASIVIEVEPDADMQAALSSVESAVSRITTLPVDSFKPKII